MRSFSNRLFIVSIVSLQLVKMIQQQSPVPRSSNVESVRTANSQLNRKVLGMSARDYSVSPSNRNRNRNRTAFELINT
jgi:hypothetical protein